MVFFTGQVMKKSLAMIWDLESLIVLVLIQYITKGSSQSAEIQIGPRPKV